MERIKLLLIPVLALLILNPAVIDIYADSFARPDSSPSVRWVNGVGGGTCTDLLTHNCVNEVVRNDATYIQTTALGNGGSDNQIFTLSNIADPLQSTGHILRYTLREGNQGINPVGFTITLRQGATVIATFTHPQGTLPTTFTLFQQTLTNTQADSITDYNNLELTLNGFCTIGCANQPASRERVAVSWVEFAIVTQIQPPSLNAISVLSSTSLQLFWTQPLSTTGILSYNIERSSGGSPFTVIGNVPVGTITFIDGGLIPNTSYTYRLISIGSSGNSISSNQLTQTTSVFIKPSDFARPDSSISLRWVDGIGLTCTGLNNYLCVDESVRDDSDYIQTIGLGQNGLDTQYFTMTDIAKPTQPLTHILRYTLGEANLGTNPVEFEIILRQGPAVIANWIHPAGTISNTITQFERQLTAQQISTITDYNALELTLIGRCDSSCSNSNREKIIVTWIELEIIPFVPTPTLSSNYIGRANQISWIIPTESTVNNEQYGWIIQRDVDDSGFINIASGQRDPNNKPIENGVEYRYYLDEDVQQGKTYKYKMTFSSSNGRNSTLTDQTNPITVPNESAFIFKASGKLLDTTRILVPRSPIIPTLYFKDSAQQYASAETGSLSPQVISNQNPKDEPYLFSLNPLPSPQEGLECSQIVEIIYKRNDSDFGQDLTVFATILENQTIERNQHLYDKTEISDSAHHIFNYWWIIPPSEQTIQNYENLEIQLDIDSSTTLNPLDYRSISIYQVNFYVPDSNQMC